MQPPYLEGSFAPTDAEHDAALTVLEGEVPADLAGAYVRNGPNPRFAPMGRHHWFDGDGMLHAVRFRDGEARYRSRYVRTDDFEAEGEAGEALFRGLLEPAKENPTGRYKDSGNTDVLPFGGELLTLHYMAGKAWRVDRESLETRGALAWPGKLSAHAKVDPRTGELLFFDYGPKAPFLTWGTLRPDGTHQVVDLGLEAPTFPHDMAFTERFAILMEPPVTLSLEHARRWRWGVVEDLERPFRFHLSPRAGGEARTFEAAGCYLYHVCDAWEERDEEGGSVVLVGFRCPRLFPEPDPADGPYRVMMANLRLRATLHRWRFDLRTGACAEEPLDDLNAEFPTVDDRRMGQGARFAYAVTIPTDRRRVRFDGLVKHDLRTGARRGVFAWGENRFGSEAPFAPRVGSTGDDDGYLVSFVHEEGAATSEVVVLHAETMELACRLAVPHRVPLGFHACWAGDPA
ncbi:MAG TPA: carotenoid oxygenase family protein [Polyangiaceae bacterium LLY-WYZ-15_(1-7)]|nr:9-cis-epoxycarotenoid dioxygenase [Myxococcales bacterium]MAT24035.1 9-cis-epoxycarotenoid dioxygenase [Sandaracinus sp.]HJK94896.1 carotenoid oxygenase family protein [Polyangiaceae bacterium LLY-WYZ-15_(1-7)]MBJ72603.1 9-cis-epoxycarotenoid dioxygenase [Sandaracinus sp.]HJL06428.1 carotenoid oxygenase family protein [Polyangiaceae bacterium LLY-WYZ-15_(1-7)]